MRCSYCRRDVQPGDPTDVCPGCGYDGYSDRDAHTPRLTRPRLRPDDDDHDRTEARD